MRKNTPSHSPQILSLSLVFLLTGLLGCSHGSLGEQQASGSKAAAPAPAAAQGTAATPAAPSGATTPAPSATPAPPGMAGAPPAGAAAGPAPVPLSPDKIPAVVAKVNGQDIKKDELLKTADQVHTQMAPNQPMTADFYRKVLENIVARQLLLQDAKTQGVTATDDEIKKQIDELKARFPSPDKYQEELKKEGMTEPELIARARDAFLVQRLIETKVVAGVAVTDAQEKAFYDQNQQTMKRPERIHVEHILIKVAKDAPAADKAKAKAKADDILAKLKAGGDFAKLATENSDDPGSKQRGGDLGWLTRGQTVPPFEAAAFALKTPKDLSPVVESEYGYHIIRLVEHQDAGVVPFADVKDKIGDFLKQRQQQEKVQQYIKALRDKGKVEVFV